MIALVVKLGSDTKNLILQVNVSQMKNNHWTEPKGRQFKNIQWGCDHMSNNLIRKELVIPHRVLLDKIGACSFP